MIKRFRASSLSFFTIASRYSRGRGFETYFASSVMHVFFLILSGSSAEEGDPECPCLAQPAHHKLTSDFSRVFVTENRATACGPMQAGPVISGDRTTQPNGEGDICSFGCLWYTSVGESFERPVQVGPSSPFDFRFSFIT